MYDVLVVIVFCFILLCFGMVLWVFEKLSILGLMVVVFVGFVMGIVGINYMYGSLNGEIM